MSGAKDLLAGAHTATERMEIFDPVIEELFHVEQDFLEKMFKRFYSTKTSRQEGSLAFFKCQLRRTNVNGQVKGGFQAHSDFLHTVGEALLIQLCMKKFSMDSLESEPVIPNLSLPENIRNTHIKTREPLFWKVVKEIVNEIFMEFHNPGCLPPVQLDFGGSSVIIPREQLCKNGYVDVKVPSGEVLRVFNSHETTDDIQNYSLQLLMWYIHFCEFQDGIREGDPFRTNINLKRMIPFFYSHSDRSKYAVECIDYILKTEVLLPQHTAMRVRLGSFVNPHGKKGGNKPADMQQENNILVLKDVIKGLGANKTTKAMERASAAAPVVAETVENYMNSIGCVSRSGKHNTKDNLEDVKLLVQLLSRLDPFSVIDNRKMNFYSGFRKNPFSAISSDFNSHLFKIVERLKRCQNIDLEYYNQ
ncbi:uncharacterized protein LOC134229640 isoform X2 [Saccostrea cucullata]|uniref:uncharacterized protein LOC134229640 isoform X2 n=1 Tax=Saccostrea cuccullata TaxID=36930 RepID=UPI002ED2EE1F